MDGMSILSVCHTKLCISDTSHTVDCRSRPWSQAEKENLRNVKQKRTKIKQEDVKFTEELITRKIKWKTRKKKAVSSYTYVE